MFESLTSLVLAALPEKINMWHLLYITPYLAYRGAVQGGFAQLMQLLVDHVLVTLGKDKKYDICKENIDMSGKIISQLDWFNLESPMKYYPFSLDLSGSDVKDEDLINRLANQKKLRSLNVSYCENITHKGVKKFKKLRPDCRVKDTCSTYLRQRVIGFILFMLPIIVFLCDLIYA